MWKYPPFLDFVSYIVKLDVISEFIIINNSRADTPNHPVLLHPKIKIIDFGKNIFVNPAWNHGVNSSRSDIVCLMNDDLTFDIRLFFKISEFFSDEIGVIGLSSGRVEYNQTPITTGAIDFEAYNGQMCYGFGELMFVNKKTWKNIPDQLLIGFGDNFIFDYYYFNRYTNYLICNMFHYHAVSQTTSEVVKILPEGFYDREHAEYVAIKQQIISNTL